jgi:hypothetical protein
MFHFFHSRFIQNTQQTHVDISVHPLIGFDKPLTIGRGGSVSIATLMRHCPQYIALRARIRGQPLSENHTYGRSFLRGVGHTPIKLYDPEGPHLQNIKLHPSQLYQAVQVIFTGQVKGIREGGFNRPQKSELTPGDVLLEHLFQVQSGESCDLSFEQLPRNQWKITPPGLIDRYPLWPYAGIINPETLAIEQLFFTLSYIGSHTQVVLFKGSELDAHGVKGTKSALVKGRQVMLMDPQQFPHQSWETLLKPIRLDWGEDKNIRYQASHLEPAGDYGCWVYFKRHIEHN